VGIIANYHPSWKTRCQLEEEIFICSTTKHSRAEHYGTNANNNLTHDKLPTSLYQYGSYWCKHPKSLDNYWNCRETRQFISKWNRVVGTSYAHSTTTFTPKLKLLNHNRRRMLNTAWMRNNSQEILSMFASRRMARRKIVARCQVAGDYSGLRKFLPAYLAEAPSSSSMRSNWLYFASRSLRHGAPVLIYTVTTTPTTVLQAFVWNYPGEPVRKETFTHPPSSSSSNHFQLLPSTTIHSILPVNLHNDTINKILLLILSKNWGVLSTQFYCPHTLAEGFITELWFYMPLDTM